MLQLILKDDIEKSKIDTLLSLLNSWNVESEIKNIKTKITKTKKDFSLSVGIWKDYNINANELRKKAWNKEI